MPQVFSLSNPWFLYLLAFLLSCAVAGVARLAGGPGRGAVLAGSGISIGFLGAWLALYGMPAGLPRSLFEQLPFIALAGCILGLLIDAFSLRKGARTAALVVCAILAAWTALRWPLSWSWPLALKGGLLLAAWVCLLLRLDSRPYNEPVAPVMLLMAALALAAMAWMVGQAGWMRLGGLAAAATAGVLVWAWAIGLSFSAAALLGGGGLVMGIAQALGLAQIISPFALAVLLLIFFADGTAQRLVLGSGLLRRLFQPLGLALVCLFPIALALAVAYVAAEMRL